MLLTGFHWQQRLNARQPALIKTGTIHTAGVVSTERKAWPATWMIPVIQAILLLCISCTGLRPFIHKPSVRGKTVLQMQGKASDHSVDTFRQADHYFFDS